MVKKGQHRVLLYTPCYNIIDGVTLTVRKIEQGLLEDGHAVCVLTTRSGDARNTHMDGLHPNRYVAFLENTFPIPWQGDPKNKDISYYMGLFPDKKMKQFIANFNPNIVHITAPDLSCVYLIQFARENDIPLMGTYHSNIPEYFDHYTGASCLQPFLRIFFRHEYSFLQKLYVPTPFIRNHIIETYNYKVKNLAIWGRGVDLQRFDPSFRSMEWRRALGIQDDEVVVCWVGRIMAEKRPDIFAEVIRRLYSLGIKYKALIVGTGPAKNLLTALPNAIMMGWMSGRDLSVAYASSDVFLFPSAVETFGNVSLEAGASGLPVIVESNCSGHVVKNGVNGYACVLDDVDAYFDATHRLVTDEILRRKMSKAAREFTLGFENRKVVREMVDNYAKVKEEFQTTYGGSHANRDIIHKDDYMSGQYPRPLLVHVGEFMFLLLGSMISLFVYARQFLPHWAEKQPLSVVQKDGSNLSAGRRYDASGAAGVLLTSLASIGDSVPVHFLLRILCQIIILEWRLESSIRKNIKSLSNITITPRKRKDSDNGILDGTSIFIRDDGKIARRVRSA